MSKSENLRDRKVSQEELVALVQHCQRHNKPWPPLMNIARRFGVSSNTISDNLAALIKSGRVLREGRGQYSVPRLPALEVQP